MAAASSLATLPRDRRENHPLHVRPDWTRTGQTASRFNHVSLLLITAQTAIRTGKCIRGRKKNNITSIPTGDDQFRKLIHQSTLNDRIDKQN